MFGRLFDQLIILEGGEVDHPDDPGGFTRWGVSERFVQSVGEKMPTTKEEAAAIYRKYFYEGPGVDRLPEPARTLVFLTGVLIGTERAIRTLQQILNLKPDGVIGPVTIAAAAKAKPHVLVGEFVLAVHRMLKRLPHYKTFGDGWTKRLALTAYFAAQNERTRSSD